MLDIPWGLIATSDDMLATEANRFPKATWKSSVAVFAYAPPDRCIEYGPHVGYNQAAYEATVKAVREFLTATFKLSG